MGTSVEFIIAQFVVQQGGGGGLHVARGDQIRLPQTVWGDHMFCHRQSQGEGGPHACHGQSRGTTSRGQDQLKYDRPCAA